MVFVYFVCPVRAETGGLSDCIKDNLRTAEFLPEAGRATIQKCVEEQVRVLLDEEAGLETKRKVREDFRQILIKEPTPTAHFKDRFVSIVVQLFTPHLKAAAGPQGSGAGATSSKENASQPTSPADPTGCLLYTSPSPRDS